MSKKELINETISKFKIECSEIDDVNFIDKISKHEEIMIRVILETVLKD